MTQSQTLRLAGVVALGFACMTLGCGHSAKPAAAGPSSSTVLTPAQIAERSNPSVVLVTTDRALGSGFVVGDDLIATNMHVLRDAKEARVAFSDGRKLEVIEVTLPLRNVDLVLMRVDAKGLARLAIGDSASVHPGDHVVAIGNPKGLDHTVSDGLLSAVRKQGDDSMLQISAPIQHGSSGGPVFNDHGEVIGIATLGSVDAHGNSLTGDLNFAIPSSELKALLSAKSTPLSMSEFRLTAERTGTRACLDGSAEACDRQCRAGTAAGCTNHGVLLVQGKSVPRDVAKAADLYKRGCDGGDLMGCSNLASLYRAGDGVGRDYRKALELFSSSCDRGNAPGCWGLSHLYMNGEGVARDRAKASQMLERACDGRWPRACMEGGDLYEKGVDFPKRLDRASTFYQRACDQGAGKGCTKLGLLMSTGRGVPRDEARAVVLFRRGCENEDQESCANYGKALVDGRGITVNRAEGVALLQRACREGLGWSCEKLRSMGEKF